MVFMVGLAISVAHGSIGVEEGRRFSTHVADRFRWQAVDVRKNVKRVEA